MSDEADKKVLHLYDIISEAAGIAADALASDHLTYGVQEKANSVLEHYFDWVLATAGCGEDLPPETTALDAHASHRQSP